MNLFDDQRFGKENLNHEIGKALLKNDGKKACDLLGLVVDGNDYVNMLRKINTKLFRFYISAYQSFIWNKVVKKIKKRYEIVPLLGFLTEMDGEIKEQYEKLMKEEGIAKENFLVKHFPELSAEGGERKMYAKPDNFNHEWREENGRHILTLKFYLEKGAYATMFVKALFE